MGELLEKGHARKSERKANDGGLWYLPHHGVRHPSKPGKLRIVFHCSANFRGACLNKLWCGPGLTIQLVAVPFTGEIEAIFYQVQVTDNQRGFLRYLWWEKDILEGELVDYKMYVYVFAGTSFPGCCNYTLRKTSLDDASDFKVGVAETLMKNLYVADLLKSVESKESEIQLHSSTRTGCSSTVSKNVKFPEERFEN